MKKEKFKKIRYKEQQKNKKLGDYSDEELEEPARYEDETK